MDQVINRKLSDDPIELLFQLTDIFWQVGAVLTALSAVVCMNIFNWVVTQNGAQNHGTMLQEVFIDQWGHLLYLLPLLGLIVTITIGVKTLNSYRKAKCSI